MMLAPLPASNSWKMLSGFAFGPDFYHWSGIGSVVAL